MGIRHKRWIQWSLMLAVLFCLVLPSLTGTNLASDGLKKKNDTRLHYIVQFWHADGSHDSKKDKDGYLAKDGDKEIIKVKDNKKKNETFSGFATAAGHDAVERNLDEDNSTLTIKYQEDIHLAKVNVFYKSKEKEKEGSKDLGVDETKVIEGVKYYNTSQDGLHTDKTAKVMEGSNGRDFELTLESWFVGGDVADVGMVLDASGSMAFTSDDLEPIHLDEKEITENGFDKMRFLSQDEVDKLLDKNYTDNSKLAYSGYTYFVYDGASNGTKTSNGPANEFVPIGYWDGKPYGDGDSSEFPMGFPKPEHLTGFYPFNDNKLGRCNYADEKRGIDKNVIEGDESKKVYVVYQPTKKNGNIEINKNNQPIVPGKDVPGFNNTGRTLDLVATYNSKKEAGNYCAAVLDIHPNSSDSFTISFAVNGSSSKPVVWIGEKDQREEENQAWYAIYADTKKGTTTVASGIGSPTEDKNKATEELEETKKIKEITTTKLSVENDWALCTYVFEKDNENNDIMNVTIYVNGEKAGYGKIDNIHLKTKEKPLVVLGGSAWVHDFGGNDWDNAGDDVRYLVDELYFYECALTEQQVGQYHNQIMPSSDTGLYAAMAPSDQNKTIAKLQNADVSGGGKGWYLVSSDSAWDIITDPEKNLLTGKRYNGIPKNEIIYNRIENVPDKIKKEVDLEGGNTSDYIQTGDKDFTGKAITKKESDQWNGSIIFYIDNAGYLRCFYNSGASQDRGEKEGNLNLKEDTWLKNESHCSYVFKKEDSQQVKTEALQLALGSFVSRLSSASSDSEVSAVRFSTENIKDGKQLIMMDWTKNTIESTGMLGLRRGENDETQEIGTAIASSKSKNKNENGEGKEQYNYVLTGGTVTHTGLQSYKDNLDVDINKNSKNKALIIFTDGKDTTLKDEDEEQSEQGKEQTEEEVKTGEEGKTENVSQDDGEEKKTQAELLADDLKADGYTIYCVMLQTAAQTNDNDDAIKFLEKLASKEEYVYTADDVETLTDKFTSDILDKIVNNLADYVVQDYIDPRFDLVDADENVYHLNAAGNIVIEDKKGNKKTVSVGKEGYKDVKITKTTETEDTVGPVGKNATLLYDGDKDMYYLKWEDQTIPGCNKGAQSLNVWKSRIHVRAKEDFIGGNAILTNGNEADMNMVYHKDTKNPSSGKENTKYKYEVTEDEKGNPVQKIHYPSKGFPRTTVNVKLLDLNIEDGNTTIYMGQKIDPSKQLEYLGGTVDNKVYYEYLERYAKQGASAQQKIEQLKKGEEISILYYYLPDIKSSNQTGGDLHKNDQIGELTYKWIECDGIREPKDNPTYGPFETKDTDSRYYQLSISYKPLTEEERKKEEEKLITDPDYGYQELKSVVGDEQKAGVSPSAIHRTDIVRGEIIVEARVLLDDLKYLAEKNDGKLDLKEKFTVERSYDKITKYDYDTIEIAFPTYTTAELDELSPDEDGYVSIYSKPSKPLPIGVYTLKAVEGGTFKFGNIKANNIVNSEDGKEHFTIHPGKESEYIAPPLVENSEENSVSFYMGVSPTEGNSEVDLDAQLGHAVVTYELDRPEPTPTAVPTASPSPEPTASPDPTPTIVPTASPSPVPTATPSLAPVVDLEPTVSPNPEKTPKATKKPKKNTKKPTKISSTPQPNTNIDDKLPTGRKNLGDPNRVPDTRDTAEPAHALLLLILTAVLILSVELKELEKKEKK